MVNDRWLIDLGSFTHQVVPLYLIRRTPGTILEEPME
jgi:hypothetical protein